jgi:hypothetical protein
MPSPSDGSQIGSPGHALKIGLDADGHGFAVAERVASAPAFARVYHLKRSDQSDCFAFLPGLYVTKILQKVRRSVQEQPWRIDSS